MRRSEFGNAVALYKALGGGLTDTDAALPMSRDPTLATAGMAAPVGLAIRFSERIEVAPVNRRKPLLRTAL